MTEKTDLLVALIPDRVIDGHSEFAINNQVVLVKGKSIQGFCHPDRIPAEAKRVDLTGMTLMPGMINCHEHPLMYADDYQSAHMHASSAYKALKGLASLQRLLLHGWTGVRVLGDADVYYGNQDIRKVIEEGVFTGPRITGAGHYISITGGGGDINFVSPEHCLCADGLIADGADEMLKAIRRESKFGADWIKLLVTGAFQSVGDDPKNVAFSPDELKAAVDEANRQGLPVAVHAHGVEGIKQAVKAGVRSIEHGTYINEDAIELMVKHGTYLVPTIYIGDYYGETKKLRAQDKNDDYFDNYRAKFLAMIGKAHQAGVPIAVGLDLGGYNMDPKLFVKEFPVLMEAGMTAMEAIKAGTSVAAQLLMWDKLGTIKEGQLADIIAVSGNPLEQISDLENVEFVMIDGQIVRLPGTVPGLAGVLT
ncbi:MAG: imidazolonepropionase-like amidohydrolase [Lysobacterales bacterium]|jgi:imidazolonepropionase-like amidohydrolase